MWLTIVHQVVLGKCTIDWMSIGESDVKLSDAMRLATHLAENRVCISLEVWPDMFHVWNVFASVVTEGIQALESAASFLDEVLNSNTRKSVNWRGCGLALWLWPRSRKERPISCQPLARPCPEPFSR